MFLVLNADEGKYEAFGSEDDAIEYIDTSRANGCRADLRLFKELEY